MNINYVIKLYKTNRYGKLIKLIEDNIYNWSIDDYSECYKICKMNYVLYKYFVLLFSRKNIINVSHFRIHFRKKNYYSYTYKDEDYDKMVEFRYIISNYGYNINYYGMRCIYNYSYSFQSGYSGFKFDLKMYRFIYSHKYINININERYMFSNNGPINLFFKKYVLYCDDTLEKINIINDTPEFIVNLIDKLIKTKCVGHLIKLINKYKSIININTFVRLMKDTKFYERNIRECIMKYCDLDILNNYNPFPRYDHDNHYSYLKKKLINRIKKQKLLLPLYEIISHDNSCMYYVCQPKLVNIFYKTIKTTISALIKSFYEQLENCRLYRKCNDDDSPVVKKLLVSIPDMKTYNTIYDILIDNTLFDNKIHSTIKYTIYKEVLDLAHKYMSK